MAKKALLKEKHVSYGFAEWRMIMHKVAHKLPSNQDLLCGFEREAEAQSRTDDWKDCRKTWGTYFGSRGSMSIRIKAGCSVELLDVIHEIEFVAVFHGVVAKGKEKEYLTNNLRVS